MATAARLSPSLLADWKNCISFARAACTGRGCSHNHTHAQDVLEGSLVIAQLEGLHSDEQHMRRLIHVAACHDVADHKYEKTPGQLTELVQRFVGLQFASSAEDAAQCLHAIEAISFSKEKKNGKRWFEASLSPEWLKVRDHVSDADKLTAIGMQGLTRCWVYGLELMHADDDEHPEMKNVAWHTKRVLEHADEKLLKLKDEFIMTESGKFLAESRHDDMVEILDAWRKGERLPVALDAPLHW